MRKIILILSLIAPACSTVPKINCEETNWQNLGMSDGRRGREESFADSHLRSCESSSNPMNLELYKEGRAIGLAEYCTPENGYQTGMKNETYQHVCSKEQEPPFLAQYAEGRKTYLLQNELESVRAELRQKRKEIQEDKSVVGDVSKVYHLLSGTSPTAKIEEREERLEDQIYLRKSQAPGNALSYHPPRPEEEFLPMIRTATAMSMGMVVGFGVGHGINGHFGENGWKWTFIDTGLISSLTLVGRNCNEQSPVTGLDAPYSASCNAGAALSAIGLMVSRIWQLVEIAAGPKKTAPSALRQEIQFRGAGVTPLRGGMNLGAHWSW
ncbi:MAG: DUF2799 domain-containing protein [Bdellovibrionales bacterium]|nr:DUF2799 domain-containing protein [Bdellovibrionales bacterium]